MSQVSQGSQDEGSRNWLENILPLLSEARDMFSGDEEVNKVYEVSDSLQKMDQARSKELDTLKEKLRAHARQAESYKHSAQRPANALTEKQHESKLVELDAKKYGLAKTVADLEQAIASAEMAMTRSKDEALRREHEDPREGNANGDGDVDKLFLFQELGFKPVTDGASYSKLLISSDTDLYPLSVNDGLSDYEYAAKAWHLAT